MNGGPKKVIKIALDDYIRGLRGIVDSETAGKIEDSLKRHIPNNLKDEKKRVRYDSNNANQHVFIYDPVHPVTVTHIQENEV